MVSGCGKGLAGHESPAFAGQETLGTPTMEFTGKTQPVPGRHGKIAPAVLHPVVEIMVTPGARVKKEQPLVRIDDDEPKADVRNKEALVQELTKSLARLKAEPREADQEEARATLDSARITLQEARRELDSITPAWRQGAIPEQRHHAAKAALSKAEADERAAAARLRRLLKRPFDLEVAELQARIAGAVAAVDAAKAELEHYTVVAPIDGVVTTLNVSLGTVSRPGTSVWGEVLDLRQIDARIDLTPRQVRNVSMGQSAEVLDEASPEHAWRGQVAFISLAADPATGRVPVLVRVENPEEKLRCYINVRVRLGQSAAAAR
jgi:multidrug resistance efflux pump